MTDVASQGQEESGNREVKGEAAGTEGSARVKLIQCKMNKIKESTLKKTHRPSTVQQAAQNTIKVEGAEKHQCVDDGSWIVVI